LDFQRAINSGSPVAERANFDDRTKKTNYSCEIQVNSKEFCQYIKNHGVDENKSKVFIFPSIEEKYYSHFVRGLYDGDGSIYVKVSPVKKRIWFKVNLINSQSCVGFIKNYLSKLGISTEKIFAKPAENIF
jgi:intein-encoded DNA endonuclease-like protein